MIIRLRLMLVLLLVAMSLVVASCNRSEPGPDEYPKARALPTRPPAEPTPSPLGGGQAQAGPTPSGPASVGDVQQSGDVAIKLNSVNQDSATGTVVINVTVQNRGQIEANINPAFYFQIKEQDGTLGNFMNFGTPNPRIPSSVPAGGEVVGNMSFQGVDKLEGAQLIYDPKNGKGIAWALKK